MQPKPLRHGIFKFRPTRPRAGVSMLESLIAVMVVAIGMAATLNMLMVATANSTYEQERSRANQLVCQYMEEKVILPLLPEISSGTEVTIWDNGTPNNTSDDTRGVIQIIAYDMETGARINSIPVNPMNRVRYRVEVTMTWHPRGSKNKRTLRETVMTYKVA